MRVKWEETWVMSRDSDGAPNERAYLQFSGEVQGWVSVDGVVHGVILADRQWIDGERAGYWETYGPHLTHQPLDDLAPMGER